MATYYVAKTGDDSNGGTDSSAPKLTITSAWNAVSNDDTIEIMDSETYVEGDISTRNITGLTVKATSGKTPVISGGGCDIYFLKFREGWTFEGLTFDNFAAGTSGIITHGGSCDALTVTNCTFQNSTGVMIKCSSVDETTISRCTFKNNSAAATTDTTYQISAGTKPAIISNCLFYNIGIRNVNSIVIYANHADTSITHCTIAKRDSTVSNPQIPNTVIWSGAGDVKFNLIYNFPANTQTIRAGGAGTVSYNTWGSTTTGWEGTSGPVGTPGTVANNIAVTSDPGFVSYSGDNYRLMKAARSIAMDAASGSTETVDITGESRVSLDQLAYNSGILDMGCYEASFYTVIESETVPQIGSDFTINTHLLSSPNFHRAKPEAGSVQVTLQQVPFSAGVNGAIPSVVKQTGHAPNATEPRVSYSNSKGDSKS